ncbi:MAG TPA: EAL domain-containing protein [Thermoanaerobaculia bacterium]|nr:EAL domain-containing protein [Thermoanaerobaculia bacterium]
MTGNREVRARRLAAAAGVFLLAVAAGLLAWAAGVEPRALAAAGAACDAEAVRSASGVGPLLAFRDAEGALEAIRDGVRGFRPLSTVVLDASGRVRAAHAVPIPGLAHVSHAEVFFEGRRLGSVVLGFSLEEIRERAAATRRRTAAAAAILALAGLGALALAARGRLRSTRNALSAEERRVAAEREDLAARAADAETRLEHERRDRRIAESALSSRDLFEIERTEILEMIARGDALGSILSSLAALVEHRRPGTLCLVAPLRQGVLPVGSAGEKASPFRGGTGRFSISSTAPPLALAAETGDPVVTRDTPDDPLWGACRDLFAPDGIAACWTVPISSGTGTVFGTLSVLHTEAAAPGVADLALLENAARLAAIAIEQRQLAEQLAFQARYDRLTNLPNRLYLEEALGSAVSRAARRGERATLLFVDLDRFKRVNDTFGHAGGDALLTQVARRLTAAVADGDVVARMGGDEFCVLRVGPAQEDADRGELSRIVLEALRAPFDILGEEVVVGASVGVSAFPDDAQDAMALRMHADAAMYAAKEEAGNCYHLFEPGQTFRGGDRLRLENDLRRAIAGGELSVEFQPQTSLDGLLRGAEALVRWRHPVLGEVRPSRFVPIAEESGLILDLGAWVFEEVCRRIGGWRRAGLSVAPISVNVSPVQFSRADLVQTIEASMASHGVPASLIRVELTESLLIKDAAATMTHLGRLKNLGVGLAVDDFGTGYSSLSYLQLLPIDELKIDQGFVREIGSPAGRAPKLVQSMVSLGHSLGLVVVAEGVETRVQLDFLERAGCDRVQGFAVGPPVAPEAFARLLEVPDRPLAFQLDSGA